MNVILADSFTGSLARLNRDEQKQAKLTAFDLQTAPDHPGLQFHRIEASKDPNFWSVRVSRDIRIIVHKAGPSVMLAYVGHHDDAYAWAERRRIENHPRTGAIQIVEVRERVEELVARPRGDLFDLPAESVVASAVAAPIFATLSRDDLLSIGVPEDWLSDVSEADEDRFLDLAKHLPDEATEALLRFVGTGVLHPAAAPVSDPFAHPDTQRRFRVLEGAEELRAALDASFERWAVFLHPSQRDLVERSYSGPARVAGSAGTGKTVVALHRVARSLAYSSEARVLLTTFSQPLADILTAKLGLLLGEHRDRLDRVTVASFEQIATELYALATGRDPHLASAETIRSRLIHARDESGAQVSDQFLVSEWTHVIDAWQLDTLDAYAAVARMGRKNRLGAKQREQLWAIFEATKADLKGRGLMTRAGLFAATAKLYRDKADKPFSHIVVDEAQDLGVPELRLFAAIIPVGSDAFFFAGDLGQRIFQQPFSWKSLGFDLRGRSSSLKVNYRTSHQIRQAADRLLGTSVRDVDGMEDDRSGTVSVFNGPEPQICVAEDIASERAKAVEFLDAVRADGVAPAEIGIFARSERELPRARAIAESAKLPFHSLAASVGASDRALIGTMHLAKGLEYKAVLVVACDQGVLPLDTRIADVADEYELDEIIATERQLFYVAVTRARDYLFVSGVSPGSEFIADLQQFS
jgi:hypothetical protein